MCHQCDPVRGIVEAPKAGRWRSLEKEYLPAIAAMEGYIDAGVLELYAGDGPLDTILAYFDTSMESAFVRHYFRCRHCGQFFLAGLYCRGEPLLKVSEPPTPRDLARLWGREGVYFEGK